MTEGDRERREERHERRCGVEREGDGIETDVGGVTGCVGDQKGR